MHQYLKFSSILFIALVLAQPAYAQWTTQPVTAPRVQYRTFQSTAAGATVSYHVYTPPAYDTQPQRRFPVLYWLHGSDSVTSGIPGMSNWFASAMARGDLPPMIVVFPNGMPYGMYSNSADGVRPIETVIMQELLPLVDATFRTIPDSCGRILEGFSMGGYGTGRLGFQYSDRFAAASMLGAGPVQLDFLDAPPGTSFPPALRALIYQSVWNSNAGLFYAASPWNIAQTNASTIVDNKLRIRIAVGQSDAMLGPNADLHAHLVSLNIPHSWQTYSGVGHDTLALLTAMGPSNWSFYISALAPGVAVQPVSQSVCVSGTAALVAEPSGSGAAVYQWRKGGVAINISTNPSAATGRLTLVGVQAGDAGSYDCVITTPCGSATSNAAVLTVASCGCGPSDVAGPGQSLGSDNALTADDIIVYLNWFFASDVRADVAGPGQSTVPDGQFTADDIIVFLNRFFAGC